MSEVRRFKLKHLGMSGGADSMELWVAPEEDFPSGRETSIVLESDHNRVVVEMQKRIERLEEALRFYGPSGDFDLANYSEKITEDCGDTAREALNANH